MPQPSANFNPLLRSEQILDSFKVVLRAHLPLELQGTRIRADDVWQILCDASVQQTSIEASCQRLAGAPSGNRLREVLLPSLPARAALEDALNAVLAAALPRVLCKGKAATVWLRTSRCCPITAKRRAPTATCCGRVPSLAPTSFMAMRRCRSCITASALC